MRLDAITPLLLTYNEEANIGRTLDRLSWAKQILIVDSYSTDDTRRIAREYPQVDVVEREFDHFANQCNYGLKHIDTPWVLSLDADYRVSDELAQEMRRLSSSPPVDGYTVPFVYCVFGTPLRGTLYPPRTVLYRRSKASYRRDGHAHQVQVDGPTRRLEAPIYHDDRKPLSMWLDSQRRYARMEADKLVEGDDLKLTDRLRKTYILGPLLTPLYCLFVQGLLLDGPPGWYYTLQRTYAEVLLSLVRLDKRIRPGAEAASRNDE